MARTFVAASSQRLETSTLPATAVPFTIAGWVNPTSLAATQTLWALGGTGLGYFEARINTSGDLIVDHYDGTTLGRTRIDGSMTTGAWQHITCVFASSTSRSVYRNGGGKTTDTTSVGTPANLTKFVLGVSYQSSAYLQYANTALAEFGAWDVALDDAEVAALGKRFSPPRLRPQSLVGYWPLFGNDSPERDRGKNKNDLTVTGATKSRHSPMIYGGGPQ
jgi:hypothetical protein